MLIAMNLAAVSEGGLVAGADGCRDGWICLRARKQRDADLEVVDLTVVPDFATLIRLARDCAALAVDIPIGLSEDGRRQADYAARRLLGPRRSSVFPPPPRFVLGMDDYETANSASKSRFRRGLQKQTFNISPKIREADAAMRPELQERIVESHPEVSFWALGGESPLVDSKHTPGGIEHRLRLLQTVFGDSFRELAPPKGAKRDDLYDACVLAWSASRVAARRAIRVPAEVERDERGLRMEIVY